MVRRKQTKEYTYARYRCYYCNCYNEIKWEKGKEQERIMRCFNCKRHYTTGELKLNKLTNYEILDSPSEREVNRSINVTDYGH